MGAGGLGSCSWLALAAAAGAFAVLLTGVPFLPAACSRAAFAWTACVLLLAVRLIVHAFVVAPRERQATMLVVLGSGGHTAEMVAVLRALERHSRAFAFYGGRGGGGQDGARPRAAAAPPRRRQLHVTYVVAASDRTSVAKVRAAAEEAGRAPPPASSFAVIPRSREVGQSWLTSAFTTAVACGHAALLVFKKRPDVVLCNGPGTCVPVCLCAFAVCRVLGLNPGCRQIFVESFCRVRSLSLSGKVLYPFVDRFLVQWTELLATHRRLHKLEVAGCIT